MQTGKAEPTRATTTTSARNAEQPTGKPAPAEAAKDESKRPWAVRQSEGPAWVEKVEQF